jgi:hypothetical protein
MNKKLWQDLAIGTGIGILVTFITQWGPGGCELLFIILAAIGGVIGGRKINKWWGAIVGGTAIYVVLFLLAGIYWLLIILGVPLAQ